MSKEESKIPHAWDKVLSLLGNFWVNMFAIALGVLIGLVSKEAGEWLYSIGKLYLTLLTMTVLPIVFSAIAHSLGRLLRSGKASTYMGRLVVVFLLSVLLGAVTGVVGGELGRPGAGVDSKHAPMLGELLLYTQPIHESLTKRPEGPLGFLSLMIPHNVFRAFTSDQSLAVVFLSILMGLAMGTNRSKSLDRLLEVIRGVYETFFTILRGALYGLPFGLCCLTAGQVATTGTRYLLTLSKLVAVFYLCCLVLCLIYTLVIRLVARVPIMRILNSLRAPLTIAFVGSNSLVAMPLALQRLEDDLGQSPDVVQFLVPLGVTMNRHAYPLLFALMTVFVAQTYNHPLDISQLVHVAFASALIGMAAIGPAASVAPLMAFMISPLGLPTELAVAVLVETTAIVTPIVAMTHLFGSCATATLIGSGLPKPHPDTSEPIAVETS